MIGMDARDDLGLVRLIHHLPVIAREFERGLVRLGARRGEVDGRAVAVGVLDDLLAEADRRLVGGADIGRGKGDLAHLRGGGIGQFAAAVPDIDIPQPREAIDHLAPIGEMEHRPLALGDEERRLVLVGMVQRVNQIAPVDVEQFRGAVHRILQLAKKRTCA